MSGWNAGSGHGVRLERCGQKPWWACESHKLGAKGSIPLPATMAS